MNTIYKLNTYTTRWTEIDFDRWTSTYEGNERAWQETDEDEPTAAELFTLSKIFALNGDIREVIVGPVLRSPIERLTRKEQLQACGFDRWAYLSNDDRPLPGTIKGEWLQDEWAVLLSYGVSDNLKKTAYHELFHSLCARLDGYLINKTYRAAELSGFSGSYKECCADYCAAYCLRPKTTPIHNADVLDLFVSILNGDYATPSYRNHTDIEIPDGHFDNIIIPNYCDTNTLPLFNRLYDTIKRWSKQ